MGAAGSTVGEALEGGGQLRRAAAVRGVGVAAEHVDEAGLGQRQHPRRQLLAQEEVGGRLDQGAEPDQPPDPLVHVLGEVALGVGDQRPVAALGEPLDAPFEALAERAGRRLEQDPAPRPQRDARQLLLAQRLDRRLRDLAAAQHGDRDPLAAQTPVDRLDPLGDLLDPHVVVVADVRRRADRLDPVAGRLPRQAGAVADVERAVVDSGEDVAVQVDHDRGPQSLRSATPVSAPAPGRHAATMTGMIQHLPALGCVGGLASTQ